MIERWIIFLGLSIPVILISWRTMFNLKSHGFFRLLSLECIIWILSNNYRYWFREPFSMLQILSWLFLVISLYLVIAGVVMMKKTGKSSRPRGDKELYRFEKTTELVDSGIFRYIRHPLYSSLLFLTWGIYLKHTTWQLLIFAELSTLFLYLTSVFDEKETLAYFGESYGDYMKKSKRFIPFVF
ncbi:MAG: isoprenylcysteine carboxylmethyltransferase family protein [Bacteroidales bacterium]|nr:isoprenylcysteine carboxylmethyltransferase family protein [Bacteroidales bacterium]MBN2698397.1 isoprenylcysteine carboxylmethyltransferase family protein [Bacteroidales bacterium]